MSRIVTLLICSASLIITANGYKIKRTVCDIEDNSTTIYCTCGGTGDPFAIIMNKGPNPNLGVPFYSTRFGHNFGQQLKETMLVHNRTVEHTSMPPITKVVYHNCTDYPFRLKIDFMEFRTIDSRTKVDLSKIEELHFENLHSVNIYFYSPFNWGHLKFFFNNIHNKSEFNTPEVSSLLLRGDLVLCKNPCIDLNREEGGAARNQVCSRTCFNQTSIQINIANTKDVLLHDMSVRNEKRVDNLKMDVTNVTTFRVEGGYYNNLVLNLEEVEFCKAWNNLTDCDLVLELGSGALEEEGFVGIVIAASTVILLFAIILLAVIATRPKSNM